MRFLPNLCSGVSLDQAEGEDDTDSVATAEPPTSSISSAKKGKAAQVSPSDSAIEINRTGHNTQMAMHDGSPKAAKKRLAPIEPEDDSTIKKRKTVTFDVPASRETHTASAKDEDAAVNTESSEDPLASAPASAVETGTSDEPIASEAAVTSQSTRSKTGTAAEDRNTTESNATPGKVTRSAKTKAEPTSNPAKATRKRKAQADEGGPPPPKKQTKKAAADLVGGDRDGGMPSYARATRSTRARSGK